MKDSEGKEFATKFVLPSYTTSLPVTFPTYTHGGSAQIDDRRREALQRFVPALELRLRETGPVNIGKVGVFLKKQRGFAQELRDQRTGVKQFLQLFPSTFRVRRTGVSSFQVSLINTTVGENRPQLRPRLRQKTRPAAAGRAF